MPDTVIIFDKESVLNKSVFDEFIAGLEKRAADMQNCLWAVDTVLDTRSLTDAKVAIGEAEIAKKALRKDRLVLSSFLEKKKELLMLPEKDVKLAIDNITRIVDNFEKGICINNTRLTDDYIKFLNTNMTSVLQGIKGQAPELIISSIRDSGEVLLDDLLAVFVKEFNKGFEDYVELDQREVIESLMEDVDFVVPVFVNELKVVLESALEKGMGNIERQTQLCITLREVDNATRDSFLVKLEVNLNNSFKVSGFSEMIDGYLQGVNRFYDRLMIELEFDRVKNESLIELNSISDNIVGVLVEGKEGWANLIKWFVSKDFEDGDEQLRDMFKPILKLAKQEQPKLKGVEYPI